MDHLMNQDGKLIDQQELEKKMNQMREKFKLLQLEEDENKEDEIASPAPIVSNEGLSSKKVESSPASTQPNLAIKRWDRLRRIVKSDNSTANKVLSGKLPIKFVIPSASQTPAGSPRPDEGKEADSMAALELEDIQLNDMWNSENFFKPYDLDSETVPAVEVPVFSDDMDRVFEEELNKIKIEISKIPEQAIEERKEAIETVNYNQHKSVLDNIRKLQTDIIWRENLARQRVKAMEEEAKYRLLIEREKMVQMALEKEATLGIKFRQAREELEEGIKRQQAAVREHFGKVLINNDSLARRFHVFTKTFPQPIEMRIHLMRAVKNKLPKGAYCLMLTQYDSLGGHPLVWSTLGASGIGDVRPGITRIVKHYGRYFDRTLRFEDSVFALCPPRPMLKPSFCFVLELFQLSSHRNPVDKIVGWTALPMSFETMSLIEGKFKLPLIKGEHSPTFQHYKTMENTIGRDLNNWLCNIYLEVRHMSLHELGATESMLKSVDYDLDYLNKIIVNDSEINKSSESAEANLYNALLKSTLAPERLGFSTDGIFPKEEMPRPPLNEDIQEQNVNIPAPLPVDKGIFRRKPHSVPPANTPSNNLPSSNTNLLISQESKSKVNEEKNGNKVNSPSNSEKKKVNWIDNIRKSFGLSQTKMNTSDSSLLKTDESFVEQRMALIKKWKSNIRNKMPDYGVKYDAVGSAIEMDEVRERGYNLQDVVFLHEEQRGKLMGVESIQNPESRQWSAAGLEGKLVRRWQAEGSRFDTESLDISKGPRPDLTIDVNQPSPKGSPENSPNKRYSEFGPKKDHPVFNDWEELRDTREMIDYTMSVAATSKKNQTPGAIIRSKLRYITLELFGDMVPYLFGTFDFYMTVLLYLFALWMRIYVHYLGQYLYILSQNTPIYDFKIKVLFIMYKYSSESLSTAVEVGIVSMGPVSNMAVFLFFSFFGALFYRFSGFLPDIFSKFFAYYGVTVVLNPILIFFVDLIYHHYSCPQLSESCKDSYTSSQCECYNGDFIKLWYRMDRIEGSGITGGFITIMIYIATSVLSLLFLYEYLMYIHRDGRILDLWRRLNATSDEFFVPDDFEMSGEELREIILKTRRFRNINNKKRKMIIQNEVEKDPSHHQFMNKFTRFLLYEITPGAIDYKKTNLKPDKEANKEIDDNQSEITADQALVKERNTQVLLREFIMYEDGKIIELFNDSQNLQRKSHAFDMHSQEDPDQEELDNEDDQNHRGDENSHSSRPQDEISRDTFKSPLHHRKNQLNGSNSQVSNSPVQDNENDDRSFTSPLQGPRR